MSEDEKGFEIKDRRRAKEALEGEGEAQAAGAETPREKAGAAGPSEGEYGEDAGGLPPVDFLSFIGSLAATAFMYMGERLSPDQPAGKADLPSAKQMIDLLDLIRVKTKGNLEKHEAEGLDSILYNLRMRFIHETKKR